MWMPTVRCPSDLETPNGAIHMTQNTFCRVIFPKIPIRTCQNIVQLNQAICPAVTDGECQEKDLPFPRSAELIKLMSTVSFDKNRTNRTENTAAGLEALEIHPTADISLLILMDPQMHLKWLIIPEATIPDLAPGVFGQVFYIILQSFS